jgi:uncharacterized protein (TIGR02452 family)
MPVVRNQLRVIARDTLAITEQGSYRVDGQDVVLTDAIAQAVTGTRLYSPDQALPSPVAVHQAATIEVRNESSLAACQRLGGDIACLVFASARNPGGGFQNGAQAQEEAIARSSALYACLRTADEFYAHHRANTDLRYSDRVIYSPAVPVFRDDNGDLLSSSYPVSFLTAAAPNLSAIQRNQPEHTADVPTVLARRADRVLAVAAAHGHHRLVLGAWGCGVFGNDPTTVATAFLHALRHNRWFTHVSFSILDHQLRTPTYNAFVYVVGTQSRPPRTAQR